MLALEKEKAGGERIIVVAGTFVWQDFGESYLCLKRCDINLRGHG